MTYQETISTIKSVWEQPQILTEDEKEIKRLLQIVVNEFAEKGNTNPTKNEIYGAVYRKYQNTIMKEIRSYTNEDDGYGYDIVQTNSGNIFHVRQEPNSRWVEGDDISNAVKFED